jgi:hypothetical protein
MAAPITMILSVGAAFAAGIALTASLMLPSAKTGTDTAVASYAKPTVVAADPAAHDGAVQTPPRSWSEPTKPRGSELQKPVVSELKTLRTTHTGSAPALVFNDSDSPEAGEQGGTTLAERPKASKSSERPVIEPSLFQNATRVKPTAIPVAKPRSVVASLDRSRSEPEATFARRGEPVKSLRRPSAARASETSSQSQIDRKQAQRVHGEFVSGDRTGPFRKPPIVSLPIRPSERRYEEHPGVGYRTASYPGRGYVYADAGSSAEVGAPYRSQRSIAAEGEPLINRRPSAQTGVMRWLQEPVER